MAKEVRRRSKLPDVVARRIGHAVLFEEFNDTHAEELREFLSQQEIKAAEAVMNGTPPREIWSAFEKEFASFFSSFRN